MIASAVRPIGQDAAFAKWYKAAARGEARGETRAAASSGPQPLAAGAFTEQLAAYAPAASLQCDKNPVI